MVNIQGEPICDSNLVDPNTSSANYNGGSNLGQQLYASPQAADIVYQAGEEHQDGPD